MNAKSRLLQRTCFVALLSFISTLAWSQGFSLSGKLLDKNDSAIFSASVILTNQSDSSFVKGVVSDMSGSFVFSNIQAGKYRMIVQHILYDKKEILLAVKENTNLGNLLISEKSNVLNEVRIKASRPIVKMKDNVLSYDATAISEKFVRTNAYEVLGDVPGVMLKDESVQLAGASQLNIAINGKPTSLSMEQVLNMLKAMPNTNVKEIQVMYAPPARYNVKGSLINIVLTHAKRNEINGSVNAGFRQRRKSGAFGGANLQYDKDKWNFNLLYSYDYDRITQKDKININHTYQDTLYQIKQRMYLPNREKENQVQFSSNYQLDSLQTLTFSYSGNFSDENGGPKTTDASFTSVKGISTEKDTTFSSSTETLHNLKLDYSLTNKINAGVEYTFYNSPSISNYNSLIYNTKDEFKTQSKQTVNKWMLYANHSFLFAGTNFTYGGNYSHSSNKNAYSYFDYVNNSYVQDVSQSTDNKYSENAASAYVSFSKQFSPKFSLDASLKGELDKMQNDSVGVSRNIWNTFYFFPSLNASYMPDAQNNHIFQLSIESYTTYPTYWAISPATWYSNHYMLVQGNPELKPSQTYSSDLNYIFKRKYTLVLSYEYTHNQITQIPFASNESFNTIAKYENIDFDKQMTVALVLPFNISERITINLTLIYLNQHLKNAKTEDQAFDRTAHFFSFQCNSAISIWKKYGMKATLSGHYYGRGIQGIYDFEPSYKVDCGLSCNLLRDKAILSLQMNDVFNSSVSKLNIDFKNQKSRYDLDQDMRVFSVSFRYNFGKLIKEKKIEVDDSRFKRMN